MADLRSVSIQVTTGNDNDHEFQKCHNNTKKKRNKRNARSRTSKDNAKSPRKNQISPSRESKSMNTIESQDETHRLTQRTSEQSNTQGRSNYYSNSNKHDAATFVNQETSNIAFKCSAEKFLKICFASIMFLIALSSGFVSRITLHILIWHMNPPVQSNRSQINVLCGMLEPNCSSCYSLNNCTKFNKHSDSEATDENWIWAVFLVIIAPYFITFLETFFRICFKSNKKIDIAVLFLIMIIETVHSVGISILVFLVLPSFDPVSASVLFLAVAFLPPLINLIDHAVLQNQRTKQKQTKTLWQPYILSIIGVICQLAGIILIAFYIEIDWLYCLFVLGAVCVSIKYWENFITIGCGDTSNKHDNSSTTAEHLSTNGSDSPKATRSTDVENPGSSEQNNINESSFFNEPGNIEAGNDVVTSKTKVRGHESRVTTSASDSNHARDRELKGSSEQRKVKESSVSKKSYFRVVSPSELKLRYHQSRTKITCLVNLWKIVFTFVAVIVIFASRSGNSNDTFQALFNNGNAMFNTIFGEKELNDSGLCNSYVPFVLTIVNIVCSYVYYKATKTSCVIFCQRFGFCIPILALPLLSTGSLIGFLHKPDLLRFESCDIFFSDWCVKGENTLVGACKELFIAFFVLYGSMLIITRHVWKVNGYRMSETARVFVSHFYCGVFLDTSLLLNRRRDDGEYDIVLEKSDNGNDNQHRKILYACCATMWHETEKEMDQLLQSIFKLDKKQFLNERLKESLKSDKKKQEERKEKEEIETFDLEAHLIFDDAFDPIRSGQKFPDINRYVKTFINVFYNVGKKIYGNHYVGQGDGTMHTTPYGGRISWSLPGENTLVLHLKDKTKIRNKKRWSQVMYMLKILKWDLKRKSEKMTERSKEDKNKILQSMAENSYILALDGDVDFEPEAVLSLMRRMNKSSKVGAACGRIHPRGSGPMVWYQKFEYAISHWLHKATEHVIGCVLCSPGCFSLFRGAALLHPSVLQKYTKQSSEAKHFIQYDQGEDRWLCTLLLKQGWKIEYCAESDAYTFAPEGFVEFYKQRRRWTPSTLANIMDLIVHWKNVTTKNENISFLYICYQVFLFVSTLLTPGTVFMIILGAIIVGFEDVPVWLALVLNIVPVGIFLLMCLYTSEERQIQYAAILSSVYALVMIIVLIGVTRDAVTEGWCSVTTVFLLFVVGIFVITALLHPKELFCLIPGLLYFVAIPSMSMLMFFYSIGNMHVVSWGTREYEQVSNTNKEIKDSGYFCSFGNFISCMLCADNSYKKEDFLNAEMNKRMAKDKTEKIPPEDKGIQVEMCSRKSTIDQETQSDFYRIPFVNKEIQVDLPLLPKQTKNKRMQAVMFFEKYSQDKFKKDQTLHIINEQEDPSQQWPELWEDDKYHLYFNDYVPKIETSEFKFWERNISRYLKPIQIDHATEQQLERSLLSLRNRVSLFVFLVNAILVTTMYSLTQANTFKDSLAIKIDCSSKNLQIAPIALLFTIVFGFLLLLQFLCMLYHRFSTLIHITASTSLIPSKEYLLEVAYRELLESLMSPGHYHKRSEEISKSDKDRELLATQRKIDIPKHEKMESIGEMVTKNIESSKLKSMPEAVKILGVIKTWQKKIKHPAKDSIKTSDAHSLDNEAETSIKPVHHHVEDEETVVKTVY